MVFPAVMYGCEGWTVKKAESQRTDAFELWCWRRLLRVSWTKWKPNQLILKEINPDYSRDHNKLWKILKEMGIPDHLTCLLRNVYAGQEATDWLEQQTGHGTTDWFQIGNRVRQGCILSPCLFNFYAEYIKRSAGLEEAQLESRLLREILTT